MSVHAAVWCLWLAALAPLCAAVRQDVTWPVCSTNNAKRVVSKKTGDPNALWLYLENCEIRSLDPGSFRKFPKLRHIYLNFNSISRLDALLFVPVPNLEKLSLSNNALLGKDLPSQLFHNNRKLQTIDFSSNDMNEAPSNLLRGLGELKSLILKYCSLHEVPLFVTQPALNSLRVLNLNFNNITRIDQNMFIHLKNLEILCFIGNSIEHLHEDILKPLTKLTDVTLGENRIKYIPDKLFHNHHFNRIGLAINLIEHIPDNAFLNSSFKHIRIDNNRLTYLPDTFYPAFVAPNDNTELLLFSNPWQCKCLNEILVQFKRRNISYNSTLLDGKHPVCELTAGPCIKHT